MTRFTLAAVALLVVSTNAAGGGGNVDFDADVAKAFVAGAPETPTESGKPRMVIVTQPWCGACKNLKRQVNKGSDVKAALEHFEVVHAVGDDGSQWQEDGHGYVPQTYFYHADGSAMKVEGPNPQYAHFFGGEKALHNAMQKALKM